MSGTPVPPDEELSAADGTRPPFGMTGTPAADDAGIAGDLGQDAGLAAERERLSRQLRDTRVQLAMTQTRLTALEQSATMRFGRTIANAAKKPWPRGALLPRDLYKLWRDRGVPKSGAQNAASALAQAQLADLKGTGGRFLSQLTAPGALALSDPALALAGAAGASGLAVTGAISALGCATMAPDAVVHPLLPHDADIVVEATGADVVVIQASALLPGEPWAHATDPAAADRGRRLARMIVMARALGKPVILIRDVPPSLMPGIGWLAASCDAVLDGDLGVQLARFNPLGVSAARPTAPVYAGARDPREAPAVRAALDELTGGGSPAVQLAGPRSWRSLPALYRQHALFVTASASQGFEQAASGARVVGPLGSGTDAATVRAELAAARAADPLTLAGIRAGLRDIFLAHATPVRLAALVKAAGLPVSLAGGRQLAVLVSLSDGAQAGRLAATLLAQRLRPAEVIASCDASAAEAVRDALGPLGGHGIRVVVASADAAPARAGADWARPLARLARAPWAAPWAADGGQPEHYLLDLACARECAQADAVGFAGAEYEFARWLEEPALVRADLLAPGGPSANDWGSHGLRLFTITRLHHEIERQGASGIGRIQTTRAGLR
ncbi:MAG TPA: hypothetical protein VFO01_16180 [Trebonia sp.]|nr:hypothetical protein [Trebonia sp.]